MIHPTRIPRFVWETEVVRVKSQIREWSKDILDSSGVGTKEEIQAFLNSQAFRFGILRTALKAECDSIDAFREDYTQDLVEVFQEWRSVLPNSKPQESITESITLRLPLVGWESIFPIPLEWLTENERDSLTNYAHFLSNLHYEAHKDEIREILGYEPPLTPEQCERIAQQWEYEGCACAYPFKWRRMWEKTYLENQDDTGVYLDAQEGFYCPAKLREGFPYPLGIYLGTRTLGEGYYCSHSRDWRNPTAPCNLHTQYPFCSYYRLWSLISETAESLQFWTHQEVCNLLLLKAPLPACAGWVKWIAPYEVGNEIASLTLLLSPCLSGDSIREIYTRLLQPKVEGKHHAKPISAHALALYDFAFFSVSQGQRHTFSTLHERWNSLAPAEWQYQGERCVDAFRRALRRAIEQVDALIARPSYESPIRNLPPLRKRAE